MITYICGICETDLVVSEYRALCQNRECRIQYTLSQFEKDVYIRQILVQGEVSLTLNNTNINSPLDIKDQWILIPGVDQWQDALRYNRCQVQIRYANYAMINPIEHYFASKTAILKLKPHASTDEIHRLTGGDCALVSNSIAEEKYEIKPPRHWR